MLDRIVEQVTVLDVNGRNLLTLQHTASLDLSDLSPGAYKLSAHVQGEVLHLRVIKR